MRLLPSFMHLLYAICTLPSARAGTELERGSASVTFGGNESIALLDLDSDTDGNIHVQVCVDPRTLACPYFESTCCRVDFCFASDESMPDSDSSSPGCKFSSCVFAVEFTTNGTVVTAGDTEALGGDVCVGLQLGDDDDSENSTAGGRLMVLESGRQIDTCRPRRSEWAASIALTMEAEPSTCTITVTGLEEMSSVITESDFLSTDASRKSEESFLPWGIFIGVLAAILLCTLLSLAVSFRHQVRRRLSQCRRSRPTASLVTGIAVARASVRDKRARAKGKEPVHIDRVSKTVVGVPPVTSGAVFPSAEMTRVPEAVLPATTQPSSGVPGQELESTQFSASLDVTQSRTLCEMGPDELEFMAFCCEEPGPRYQLFRAAVRKAEHVAQDHGYNLHSLDPTVPGDEEEWLARTADTIVRAVVEAHSEPLPGTGNTFEEYVEFVQKHSLRECYLVALLSDYDDASRLFFLNATLDRFNLIATQMPLSEMLRARHPTPLLMRAQKEHPQVFVRRRQEQEQLRKLLESDKIEAARRTTELYRELVRKHVVLSEREKARPARVVCTLKARIESK